MHSSAFELAKFDLEFLYVFEFAIPLLIILSLFDRFRSDRYRLKSMALISGIAISIASISTLSLYLRNHLVNLISNGDVIVEVVDIEEVTRITSGKYLTFQNRTMEIRNSTFYCLETDIETEEGRTIEFAYLKPDRFFLPAYCIVDYKIL